jgi:DNA polymerase-4
VSGPRTILHLDMDAFFASVEQRDHPEYRGKPVLVGSAERRGVVAAASYEARAFGCHSAMPMAVALRKCPQAIVVSGRHSRYGDVSDQVFEILASATPLIEPLSIDEAFLDVTGTERLHGPARVLAERLRARIRTELGLTASVGIAPNKFLAKVASDLRKPDGLVEVTPDRIDEILLPLPVERLWGVGPKSAEHLEAEGIRTVADVRAHPLEWWVARHGAFGAHVHALAYGRDDRPVVTEGEAKSIGHEETFPYDLGDPEDVRSVLLGQCEAVGRRVRRAGTRARGVTVKIRYGDFETITRAATLPSATDATDELWAAARGLFDRWAEAGYRPVRLIGMSASRFDDRPEQLELFPDPEHERRRRLDAALDDLQRRFGSDAIRRRGP